MAGTWYASIQSEREVDRPVHPSTSTIGLDVGITVFATLSDGTGVSRTQVRTCDAILKMGEGLPNSACRS